MDVLQAHSRLIEKLAAEKPNEFPRVFAGADHYRDRGVHLRAAVKAFREYIEQLAAEADCHSTSFAFDETDVRAALQEFSDNLSEAHSSEAEKIERNCALSRQHNADAPPLSIHRW
jgi:hypothetical protein